MLLKTRNISSVLDYSCVPIGESAKYFQTTASAAPNAIFYIRGASHISGISVRRI
jgi:hypothetical protein